jgi:hypothetical protein
VLRGAEQTNEANMPKAGDREEEGRLTFDWLDTETKALLQRSPPEKLAPPDTATFALVLLGFAVQNNSATSSFATHCIDLERAERLLSGPFPVCVRKGLSYSDAQIGQFELICRDAMSVIIADEVVAKAPADYLADLYAKLRKIDEFELVAVRIDSVPDSPSGQKFCNRFLNGWKPASSAAMELMRKKARIMQHWATRIGVRMTVISEQIEQ